MEAWCTTEGLEAALVRSRLYEASGEHHPGLYVL